MPPDLELVILAGTRRLSDQGMWLGEACVGYLWITHTMVCVWLDIHTCYTCGGVTIFKLLGDDTQLCHVPEAIEREVSILVVEAQELRCCIVCSYLLLLIMKFSVHIEGYLSWLCIFCFILLIFRGRDGYTQTHAYGLLWGVICVFIILYLRGLDWWGMYCLCYVNGLVFGS